MVVSVAALKVKRAALLSDGRVEKWRLVAAGQVAPPREVRVEHRGVLGDGGSAACPLRGGAPQQAAHLAQLHGTFMVAGQKVHEVLGE
jgi:hypothetical protein